MLKQIYPVSSLSWWTFIYFFFFLSSWNLKWVLLVDGIVKHNIPLSFWLLNLSIIQCLINQLLLRECKNSSCQVTFIWWNVIFVGPQYRTYLMLPLWCLKCWGGFQIFGKFVHPCSTLHILYLLYYFDDNILFSIRNNIISRWWRIRICKKLYLERNTILYSAHGNKLVYWPWNAQWRSQWILNNGEWPNSEKFVKNMH